VTFDVGIALQGRSQRAFELGQVMDPQVRAVRVGPGRVETIAGEAGLERRIPPQLEELEDLPGPLARLRDEVLLALEESLDEYPLEELRRLTASLIGNLRIHLETEEARLWPLYRSALARSLDAVVPIHIDKRAQALESALDRGIAAISHGSPAK